MRVSIITVVLNGRRTIEDAIRSVRIQRESVPDLEYLVLDGGSTDGTQEVLARNEDLISHWESASDGGIYPAMNRGLSMVSGDLVGILNCDDAYEKDAVSSVLRATSGTADAVVFGDMRKSSPMTGRSFIQRGSMRPADFAANRIRINHPTCFVPRTFYEQFGGFDSSLSLGADRDLMLRLHFRGVRFVHVPKVLATFSFGGATSRQRFSQIPDLVREEYVLLSRHYGGTTAVCGAAGLAGRMLRNSTLRGLVGDRPFDEARLTKFDAR